MTMNLLLFLVPDATLITQTSAPVVVNERGTFPNEVPMDWEDFEFMCLILKSVWLNLLSRTSPRAQCSCSRLHLPYEHGSNQQNK